MTAAKKKKVKSGMTNLTNTLLNDGSSNPIVVLGPSLPVDTLFGIDDLEDKQAPNKLGC